MSMNEDTLKSCDEFWSTANLTRLFKPNMFFCGLICLLISEVQFVCSHQIWQFYFPFVFKLSSCPLLKGRQLSDQKAKCHGHEKGDSLLVLKLDFV